MLGNITMTHGIIREAELVTVQREIGDLRRECACRPEPEHIVDLVLGVSSEEEADRLSKHIRECNRCRHEVIALINAIKKL